MRLNTIGRRFGVVAALMGLAYGGAYWKIVRPVYDFRPNLHGKPRPDNAESYHTLLKAKRVVFVGAHPDDIEWWSGATAKMLANNGASVRLLLATRGDKGLPLVGWLRQQAQIRSARRLGADVIFLDFKDRKLSQNIKPLEAAIRKALQDFHPDTVFCWDPDSISNAHPDHVAVAKTSSRAAAGYRRIYYGTHSPNVWVPYDDTVRSAKWAALSSHTTEYPLLLWQRTKAYQTVLFRALGRQIGAMNAEPFRVDKSTPERR
jgi:LmbE family N-acetylglucosaminyl deacetylase